MAKNLKQSYKDKILYYQAKLAELEGNLTWESLRDLQGYTITELYIDTTDIESPTEKMSFKESYPDTFSNIVLSKSALAMAKISQLFNKFGGMINRDEWNNNTEKYVICRNGSDILLKESVNEYYFLAFRSFENRELFIKYNLPLIKDYLCMN